MEKAIKIIAAVTGLLAAVCEIMKQVNSYNENKTASSHNTENTCDK